MRPARDNVVGLIIVGVLAATAMVAAPFAASTVAAPGGGSAVEGSAGDQRDGQWRVVLTDGDVGAELWSAPVAKGEVVVYSYTHSSDKTPVESWLTVVGPDDGFIVQRERYMWYGAGLEYRSDFGVVWEDGWVVVHVNRPLASLVLRVAGTVEQRLTVGVVEVELGQLAPYGRRVLLEVKP